MPNKLEELVFSLPLLKLEDIDFHKIIDDFKIQKEKDQLKKKEKLKKKHLKERQASNEDNGLIKRQILEKKELEEKLLKEYKLPRIVFLGYFKFLSLTDQRYLCKALGFEYFVHLVPLASEADNNSETDNNEDDRSGSLLNMWRDIKKDFTKLIVIGDVATENIKSALYRKYQKADNPIITQYKIPVIMESELIKTHPDYPKINKSTFWKDVILKV
jgi:hypothetical protein